VTGRLTLVAPIDGFESLAVVLFYKDFLQFFGNGPDYRSAVSLALDAL
jgi:hypothetical protein